MTMKFMMCRRSTARALCLLLLFNGLIYSGHAQVSLVKWENFFFGPPVPATSYLTMNNGKELTNGGQSSAFVSGGEYIANGWSVGDYFQANFATNNYASNIITFYFGAYQYGAKNFKLQYAVGTPTTFTDFGSTISFPAAGGSGNYTYNLPAACNNQTNVYIRITATSVSSGGGNFWDNVEVKGSAMTAPSITSQPGSTTVCEGADATFSLTASNAISYQWQYRTSGSGTFTDCPNNATYDNETTAALTVNNVTTAMSGYQFRCIVTGGTTPNATSNTVTLTVNAYGTWNGSVNSNWNNASNWNCNTIPTASTNVIINSGGNQPVVNVTNAVCNNLTINSGATLSFTGSSNQLDIKGTVSGSGTLNGSAGKVVFSGSGTQSIPGGTYKDLQMNGGGSKTLNGNASVSGVLTFTNGILTLGSNNLTITGTGSIASGAGASSFAVTNNTGQLINQNIGSGGKTGSILFPIGASATSYTPLVINNSTGTADNFTVQVKDGVFSNYTGTTGSGAITGNAVNKTWFISEGTAGGSNATVQLTWNGNNELSGFDRDNCKLSHYTGGGWQAGPLTLAIGADPYTISRSGITSFSPFGVGSNGSPLPLDLVSFKGIRQQDNVLLHWTTVQEKNMQYFGIERSADGHYFSETGRVTATGDAEQSMYDFTDRQAPSGTLYYRLKLVDRDGSSTYSAVITIAAGGTNGTLVFPNPVKEGMLQVRLSNIFSEEMIVSVTDVTGKTVYNRKITAALANNGTLSIPVKSLPAGNYLLHISDGTKEISQSRFVKQ